MNAERLIYVNDGATSRWHLVPFELGALRALALCGEPAPDAAGWQLLRDTPPAAGEPCPECRAAWSAAERSPGGRR